MVEYYDHLGSLKIIQYLGHTQEKLNENLRGGGPDIILFLNYPSDSTAASTEMHGFRRCEMHVKCNWEIHLNYDASLASYVENTTL